MRRERQGREDLSQSNADNVAQERTDSESQERGECFEDGPSPVKGDIDDIRDRLVTMDRTDVRHRNASSGTCLEREGSWWETPTSQLTPVACRPYGRLVAYNVKTSARYVHLPDDSYGVPLSYLRPSSGNV